MTMRTASQSSWMRGIRHKMQRATKKKGVPGWSLRTNISKDIPPAPVTHARFCWVSWRWVGLMIKGELCNLKISERFL